MLSSHFSFNFPGFVCCFSSLASRIWIFKFSHFLFVFFVTFLFFTFSIRLSTVFSLNSQILIKNKKLKRNKKLKNLGEKPRARRRKFTCTSPLCYCFFVMYSQMVLSLFSLISMWRWRQREAFVAWDFCCVAIRGQKRGIFEKSISNFDLVEASMR